ncbi:3-deoxy-D-manno-octulosonic acid transferase [Rhodobacteraceae bacterium KMM 6894]|nr:3-deoxy-D-manno-octulosonic acid transferase [Rhodobacteraceae bacterium KMM 6894]
MTARPTGLLRAYGALAGVLASLAYPRVRRKLARHGTDTARFGERMGHATLPRPTGRLVWFHAASVGESLSILRLIDQMGIENPSLSFLITSGTATSADLVARRMPPRTRHQFSPLDSPAAVRRFLDHWHPDAGVFVESELWPNMLRGAADRGMPLALLNARISDRSVRGWTRVAGTARYLLGLFAMIHTQDARTTAHLHALGLAQARTGVNLKALAGPLPVDMDAARSMQNAIGARPVWVASSTHPGEEEVILQAHAEVLRHRPDALLILVPRHPDRASHVKALISQSGLSVAQRSTGETPNPATQVYLADTLGETGLWYHLCPIVCLGGSFTPVGGHNPYEPAHAGAAILHGPLYANFAGAYAAFHTHGGAVEVADAPALAAAVTALMDAPAALAAQRTLSAEFAALQEDQMGALIETLSRALRLG